QLSRYCCIIIKLSVSNSKKRNFIFANKFYRFEFSKINQIGNKNYELHLLPQKQGQQQKTYRHLQAMFASQTLFVIP
ncbi:MAG: hypothetical protein PVH43_14345, partial [Desulfobacterales bacterium]